MRNDKHGLVKQYCGKNNLQVITVERERFVRAHLKDGRQEYFLKLSFDTVLNRNLENETVWNKEISIQAKQDRKLFCVPQVFDEGRLNGMPYFLSEYFPQDRCLSQKGKLSSRFKKFIPLCVDFLFWLRTLKIKLPNDSVSTFREPYNNMVFSTAKGYTKDIDRDFKDLLSVIQNTNFKNTSLAHVEIKPDHLFDVEDKLGIIDAEWASNNVPEHYDVVSCYARTYAKAQSPEMADLLLLQYFQAVQKHKLDVNQFKQQFRGLLAWRAVGEYRDAYRGKSVNPEHEELIRKVLKNQFVFNE